MQPIFFLAQKICERAQPIIGNIMATAILNEIGCTFTPSLHPLLHSFGDNTKVVQFAKTLICFVLISYMTWFSD